MLVDTNIRESHAVCERPVPYRMGLPCYCDDMLMRLDLDRPRRYAAAVHRTRSLRPDHVGTTNIWMNAEMVIDV